MGVIFFIDALTSDGTIAPLVGICFLFVAAWIFAPLQVIIILATLSLIVAQQLSQPVVSSGDFNLGTHLAKVRFYSFVCGGLIAVMFCVYKNKFERVRTDMTNLFKLLPLPVFIVDFSGNMVFASEDAITMTGLPREKVVGAHVEEFIGAELLEETEEGWFQNSLRTPSGSSFERRVRIGGLLAHTKILKIGEGSRASIVLIINDQNHLPLT